MVAGYTRQAAANIQSGLRCNAEDVNAEYNALANAFDNTNGHDHSGSVAGDAARISLTASVTGVLPVANGGTGTASGSGGPYLPLSGGFISGDVEIQGAGLAFIVDNQALFSGGLTSGFGTFNGAGTALQVVNNASVGGTLSVGSLINFGPGLTLSLLPNASGPAWISGGANGFYTNYAVAANFAGTAFYAPNGGFVGQTATLSGTGSAVLNCPSGACSATAFNVVSDAALKTDVVDHEFGLAHILALAPKSFRYVAAPEREVAGLLAQDVASVLPHAVVEVAQPSGDPLGEPGEGKSVLALDYAAITVALVNAVKGLAAQVEALTAKVGG